MCFVSKAVVLYSVSSKELAIILEKFFLGFKVTTFNFGPTSSVSSNSVSAISLTLISGSLALFFVVKK